MVSYHECDKTILVGFFKLSHPGFHPLIDQVGIENLFLQINRIILFIVVPYHKGDKRFPVGLFEVRHP